MKLKNLPKASNSNSENWFLDYNFLVQINEIDLIDSIELKYWRFMALNGKTKTFNERLVG